MELLTTKVLGHDKEMSDNTELKNTIESAWENITKIS